MGRTVADRELGTRFAIATEADDAAIRRLLRENPLRGAISVSFEREPDYFRGANIAGGEDQTVLAFGDGRLVCMGRCTQRECWMNGCASRVAYLAELRLDATAHGRFGILRDGYRFFHEQQCDDSIDLFFTSIAADNDRALRLLERGPHGLPAYLFLNEVDTLIVAVPRHPRAAKLRVEVATPDRIPDLVRVMNAGRHNLSAVWTTDRLQSLEHHGLPLSRFLVALDGNEVIAAGALWDQRGFRQTVIRGYARPLAIARPALNLAGRVLGKPRLPCAGSVVAHAFLSPLAFECSVDAALPDLVEAFFPLAARCGVDFVTLALPTIDSRLPVLRRRFTTRTWRSRLYQVRWPDDSPIEFRGAPCLPDVALL
jgi:hypothetical protein